MNTERDVKDGKRRKKRKRDVTDNENEFDVNEEDEEVIILKRNKTTHVSLRRSARVQQQKDKMKGHLKKLAEQRTKNLAGQFVFSESSVTYRPPEGYYGNFGVTECNVTGGIISINNEDDEVNEGDSSSSTDKVIIRKPKKGFIDNELFPDDSLDVSYDTLKNNINKSISRLEDDDIDLDQIGVDNDRDVTVGYSDVSEEKRDVTGDECDVPKRNPLNLFARNRPDPVFTGDDDYRIDRTPGVFDPKWRIKLNSYPVDNRGFGQHDAVLQQMQEGDENDRHLMQVLSDVVSQSTAVSSVQNDDEEYVEEEDYEEDINEEQGHSYEVISGNGDGTSQDKSNDAGDESNSQEASGSATSAYESESERDVNGQKPPQKRDETHDEDRPPPPDYQKRDETHDEDRPSPPDYQKHDGTTEIRDGQPDAIVITPEKVVTEPDSIIDLSGQIIIDAKTGNAYNIDDVDVSQFTDVFIVNAATDNPLQNYEQVTLKLLDADDVPPIKKEGTDEPAAVLQEVQVHVHNGKKKGVEIIEISSESDNVVSSDQNTHDVNVTEEKDTEKSDVQEEKLDVTEDKDGDGEKRDETVTEDKDGDGEKRDVSVTEKDTEKSEKRDVTEDKDGDGEKRDETVTEDKDGDGEKRDVSVTEEKDAEKSEKCDVTKQKDHDAEKKDYDVPEGDAVEQNKDGKTEGKLDAVEPEEKPDVPKEKGNYVPDEVVARIEGDVGESSLTHEDTEGEKHEEKCDAAEENKDWKTEEKRDVSVSAEAIEKCGVTVTDEEKSDVPEEKRDVTQNVKSENDVMKHDDSCSSRSERIINMNKNDSSDLYDSETEDTTASSSNENHITISKKSSDSDNADPPMILQPEVKREEKSIELIDLVSTSSSEENKKIQRDVESDVKEKKQTTDQHDVKSKAVHDDVDDEKYERPDSPDSSTIKMSWKRCAIVDKVTRKRAETRSQYRCHLARKFIKTDYRYKSPNIGPELDVFEDDEGDEISQTNSDTTYKTTTTATSSNSCDNDSDDNYNEESVLYVTISFHVYYLSAVLIHTVNYITINLCNAFFT